MCKDVHWRVVYNIREYYVVMKNNELDEYLLIWKEVHEMLSSKNVAKQ